MSTVAYHIVETYTAERGSVEADYGMGRISSAQRRAEIDKLRREFGQGAEDVYEADKFEQRQRAEQAAAKRTEELAQREAAAAAKEAERVATVAADPLAHVLENLVLALQRTRDCMVPQTGVSQHVDEARRALNILKRQRQSQSE